jgi:hypothetical protein
MGVACRSSLVVSFHEEEGTFVRNIFSCDLPLSPLFFFLCVAFVAFWPSQTSEGHGGEPPHPLKTENGMLRIILLYL